MKKIILLFCSLVASSMTGWGQIEFEELALADYREVPNGPNTVEAADIDGDGDLDLLISSSDFYVSWWENRDGKGNFGDRHLINSELIYGVRSGKAADIDGDGDLDVMIAATLDIWWFENLDGKGNFGPKRGVSSRDGTRVLELGDLDGDGDPDLVTSSTIFNSDEVIAYRNNNGSFGQIQVIATRASGVRKLELKDIDRDGDLDVMTVAESSNAGLRWYPNNGNGSFGGVVNVAPLGIKPVGFFAEDLNGDSLIDVLSASARDSTLMWMENLGNNIDFADPSVISREAVDPEVVWGEDVDGDGDTDVLMGVKGSNPLRLYINQGNGVFSDPVFLPMVGDVEVINSADLDGDGDADIIAASEFQDLVAWFENLDGLGTYGDLRRVHPARLNGPRTILLTDLDNDGDQDLLAASEYDGRIAWFEHFGPGRFRPFQTITLGIEGITRLRAADLNGDNKIDLVANTTTDKQVVWLEHLDGTGTFGPPRIVAQENVKPVDVFVSDLDGDGDQDILAALEDDKDIVWYANLDGLGNFSAPRVIDDNNQGTRYVLSADVDGDGDQDILAGGSSIYNYWYENLDGQGDFETRIRIENLSNVSSLEPFDLDGDNDLDFVVSRNSGISSGSIGWIENLDGLGTFSEYTTAGSVQGALSATAADLNQDGRLDLLGAGPTYHEVVWYERVSDSLAFGVAQIISDTARGVQKVLAADIDLDGDVDVFSASVQDNKIALYSNLRPNANQVQGTVRYDFDQNGCSGSDDPAKGILLGTGNGMTEVGVATKDNGFYQLFPGEGNYTTQITSALPPYFESQPNSYASDFTGVGNIDTADFCLVATQQVEDVAVSLFSINRPRPGFEASFQLAYRNIGSTIVSGGISLEYNGALLEYLNASEAPLDPSADPLEWNYSDLKPFEARSINIRFRVFPPPVVSLNDTLHFRSTVTPQLDDNPFDNSFPLRRVVVGSYDPNDIQVMEGPEIPFSSASDYLHYLIRFQNTGNAEAIHVRVNNLIDEKLDWHSFQLEASSHSLTIETEEQRNFNFVFDNINLPDSSSNFEASNGYIAYRIKPLPDFDLGDTINNRAGIFFDFNPPIITNEVSTTLFETVGIRELNSLRTELFPNPAQNILNIRTDEPLLRVELFDMYGNRVLVARGTRQVNISMLEAGAYVVWCYGENGKRSVGRMVKMR